MTKLSDYVQTAATEYLLEKGSVELDAIWASEFFQDSGMLEEYPRQNVVVFYNMVQKELTLRGDRAEQQMHMKLEKIAWFPKPPREE